MLGGVKVCGDVYGQAECGKDLYGLKEGRGRGGPSLETLHGCAARRTNASYQTITSYAQEVLKGS